LNRRRSRKAEREREREKKKQKKNVHRERHPLGLSGKRFTGRNNDTRNGIGGFWFGMNCGVRGTAELPCSARGAEGARLKYIFIINIINIEDSWERSRIGVALRVRGWRAMDYKLVEGLALRSFTYPCRVGSG
jgi:hypothetical protein